VGFCFGGHLLLLWGQGVQLSPRGRTTHPFGAAPDPRRSPVRLRRSGSLDAPPGAAGDRGSLVG
jgi:hypothetical protein